MFVPQSYDWGQEAQVDWFEAVAKLGGERCKLQFFAMRSMASGDAFHRAYTNATQQAFLEATRTRLRLLWRRLRHAALRQPGQRGEEDSARDRQRLETERIIAFRSHWGFRSEYCNPASGNEKGGVEGELGWYRRNWLVPVPEAEDLDSLNGSCWRPAWPAGAARSAGRRHDGRRSLPDGATALAAAGGGEVPNPRDAVSADGGRQGPSQGKDQLVLDAALARTASDGARVAVVDRASSTTASAWRGTRATTAVATRFSTSNITWTCWKRNPAPWPDRRRWSNGGRPDDGPSVWTGSGRNSNERHGKSGGTREMITLVRAGLSAVDGTG